MTAKIKQMLSEREQAKKARSRIPPGEPSPSLLAMIDKAAEFIDEGCPSNRWPPSAKLKVAYYAMLTGSTGPKRAGEWALAMLDRARDRFRQGLHPDPWRRDGA